MAEVVPVAAISLASPANARAVARPSIGECNCLRHVAEQRTGRDAYACSIDVGPVILQAVEQLAAPHRLAETLVDVEALLYEEAVRVADVPVGTSRSRLFRARRLLRAQLFENARDFKITGAACTRPDQ